MSRFFLTIFILFIIASPLSAKLLRKYDIEEKIAESDVIFIGKVISIKSGDSGVANIDKYSVIHVVKVIKGDIPTPEISFVLKGSMQESDPLCCTTLGEKYIFFASDKVLSKMIFVDNKVDFEYKKINNFYTAINGPYSTYKIENNFVVGWGADLEKIKLKTAVSSIRKTIKASCKKLTTIKGDGGH